MSIGNFPCPPDEPPDVPPGVPPVFPPAEPPEVPPDVPPFVPPVVPPVVGEGVRVPPETIEMPTIDGFLPLLEPLPPVEGFPLLPPLPSSGFPGSTGSPPEPSSFCPGSTGSVPLSPPGSCTGRTTSLVGSSVGTTGVTGSSLCSCSQDVTSSMQRIIYSERYSYPLGYIL